MPFNLANLHAGLSSAHDGRLPESTSARDSKKGPIQIPVKIGPKVGKSNREGARLARNIEGTTVRINSSAGDGSTGRP